jgi:hypothetical protein
MGQIGSAIPAHRAAAIGTGRENELRTSRIKRPVICAATINQGVQTAPRLTGDIGFDTYPVRDAV